MNRIDLTSWASLVSKSQMRLEFEREIGIDKKEKARMKKRTLKLTR